MKLEIKRRIANISCHVCGIPRVETICHHCKNAMCELDGPTSPPPPQFYERIDDPEFLRLGLEEINQPEHAVHCRRCRHDVVSYEPFFYILALIGAMVLLSSILVKSLSLAVILILFAIFYLLTSVWGITVERKWHDNEMHKQRPPLPVFGRTASINIVEKITGNSKLLVSGMYEEQLEGVRGVGGFSLLLAYRDQERLKNYLAKYQLDNLNGIQFHAGFLALHGKEYWDIERVDGEQTVVIDLVDEVIHQPFLVDSNAVESTKWLSKFEYVFRLDESRVFGLPVQIIPSVIDEQETTAIELLVQTNNRMDHGLLLQPVVLELRLNMSPSFLAIENISPFTQPPDNNSDTIIWQNISLDVNKNSTSQVHSKIFYIRFPGNHNFRAGTFVTGKLTTRFSGLISRLDSVTYYSPLGYKYPFSSQFFSGQTDVEINFEFDISSLKVRRTFVESHSIEKAIVPSHDLITRLVNAMSDDDMYVQRVIENPPHTNRANAEIMNRLWVISGRRYINASPIDFRVVAIGQEYYRKADIPYSGHSRFEITVQGSGVNDSMYNHVRQLKYDIAMIIECTPEAKIWLTHNQLKKDEADTIFGCIQNLGDIPIRKINLSANGNLIDFDGGYSIEVLSPNQEENFKLDVRARESGDVPVTITAVCEDRYGKLSLNPYRCKLDVV